MTTPISPRFDDSLASVARTLHLGAWVLGALICAFVVFAWLERRGRPHWERVPCATQYLAHGPYRSSAFVSHTLRRAPWLARAASFGSVALTLVFAPLIRLALANYPFDGIAIPLVPGIVLALLNSWCAWLMLARSPQAGSAARSGAVGSLMANGGLLALAALHLVTVELQRREGIEHACSSSVTFLVLVFAASSSAQAALTLAAVRVMREAMASSTDLRSRRARPRSCHTIERPSPTGAGRSRPIRPKSPSPASSSRAIRSARAPGSESDQL